MLLETMDYQHLTKDRSLGTVELKVQDLAEEIPDADNAEYRYKSTGKKPHVEAIRLDRGGTFKGQLHYVAEFIPGLNLRGIKFDSGPNALERMVENGNADDDDGGVVGDDSSSASEEGGDIVPGQVTVSRPMGGHTKNKDSVETVKTVETTRTTETSQTGKSKATGNGSVAQGEKEPEEKGIVLGKDELLSHRAYSPCDPFSD